MACFVLEGAGCGEPYRKLGRSQPCASGGAVLS